MRKVHTVSLSLIAAVLVGCGPTDATVNSSVKQKLATDDTVKSAAIEASTRKKVVTLTGTVDSEQIRDKAVADARQTDGVSDVVNQITVAPSQEGSAGPGGTGYGPGMSNSGGMGAGGMGSGKMGHTGPHGSGSSTPPPPPMKPE